MTAWHWMIGLGITGAAALGIGLPVAAMVAESSSAVIGGMVSSVNPATDTLVVLQDSGPAAMQHRDVVVHLSANEDPSALRRGQRVRTRISLSSRHQARWVQVRPD